MKQKYYIGFFMAVFLVASLLGIGYQVSYQYVMDRHQQMAQVESIPELPEEKIITTKGTAKKNEGYYLCELQGYVVVYLSDHETIYEMTEIPLTILPENVQAEIEAGKFVETEKELYGFLENYSS